MKGTRAVREGGEGSIEAKVEKRRNEWRSDLCRKWDKDRDREDPCWGGVKTKKRKAERKVRLREGGKEMRDEGGREDWEMEWPQRKQISRPWRGLPAMIVPLREQRQSRPIQTHTHTHRMNTSKWSALLQCVWLVPTHTHIHSTCSQAQFNFRYVLVFVYILLHHHSLVCWGGLYIQYASTI